MNNPGPANFSLSIAVGFLESLGINMYTSIGKCLLEFVANAYDSNATQVTISIPYDDIEKEQKNIKSENRIKLLQNKITKQEALQTPLSEELSISIEDDGHGMEPDDIEEKFLPINRHRREDSKGAETLIYTESKKRYVMGRKGLGKLAGFGAAEKIVIETKKANADFATTITLDYQKIIKTKNIADINIPAEYKLNLPPQEHYTKVILSRLKSGSVEYFKKTIENILLDGFFGINPDDFSINLKNQKSENPKLLIPKEVAYEFSYPDKNGTLKEDTIDIPDLGKIKFKYVVKFRARKSDQVTDKLQGERGHLPARKRGARIYCNKRLAMGPTLLDLPTGMHNFHSQSYMECIVEADELDREFSDFINTNRTSLKENIVTSTFLNRITQEMKGAIQKHGKYRKEQIVDFFEKKEDPYMAMLKNLSSKPRKAAKKLLMSISEMYSVGTEDYNKLAPLLINAVNAGEVLTKLIDLGTDPKTIENVAKHLKILATVEYQDSLKIYRAKKRGIAALQELHQRGENEKSSARIEGPLHNLLKNNPWLIKPEYNNYITSNRSLGRTLKTLNQNLKIDEYAAKHDNSDKKRPDLVFLLKSGITPSIVSIVELKSPNIFLDIDDLQQLQGYMLHVEKYFSKPGLAPFTIYGHLIGKVPAKNTKGEKTELLLRASKALGLRADWEMIDIATLLHRTEQVHCDFILLLEDYEQGK